MVNAKSQRNWWTIGAVAGALLVFAALYFFLFIADDMGANEGIATSVSEPSESIAPVQLYTITSANIRDKPTTVDSNIIGKLPRGSAISGVLKVSEDGSEWLELSEGKGFVATVNLIDTQPPEIAQSLGDRTWVADSRIDIYGPATDSELIESVGEGTKLTLSGLTDTGLIEVELADGRLGYIRNGKEILARLGGKSISIAFNPQTCNFGGEVGAEFEKLSARARARWEATEAKEYPDDAAREKAMGAIEDKSSYAKLERSFEGLSLTAIGLHFESQSIYFADPPAKVIEVFRSKGFRIDGNGNFPSTELYAGISGTRGEGTAYGKSELGCGV